MKAHTNIRPRIHLNIRPGFTLIEVLIAVLILALGLLGLGAVFPVVIAQQRDAATTVEGESVASMAQAILNSTEIIDFTPWFDSTTLPLNNFGKIDPADNFYDYEWIIDPFMPYNSYPNRPGFAGGFGGSQDGIWYRDLEDSTPITTPAGMRRILTVADRLIPQPFSGKDPKYVWDIVARRQPGTNRPQLAIFIRLVDIRIRPARNATLSGALVFGDGTNGPILPVAIDPTNGRPVVDNGSANNVYAAPQTLKAQTFQDHLDWLVIEDAGNPFIDTSISFATKPGQKILDNTGTVRTIIGPVKDRIAQIANTRIVRVDPPFQPSHAPTSLALDSYDELANDNPTTQAQRASWLRQIVFTPRTPLAIRVFTLQEPTP